MDPTSFGDLNGGVEVEGFPHLNGGHLLKWWCGRWMKVWRWRGFHTWMEVTSSNASSKCEFVHIQTIWTCSCVHMHTLTTIAIYTHVVSFFSKNVPNKPTFYVCISFALTTLTCVDWSCTHDTAVSWFTLQDACKASGGGWRDGGDGSISGRYTNNVINAVDIIQSFI